MGQEIAGGLMFQLWIIQKYGISMKLTSVDTSIHMDRNFGYGLRNPLKFCYS